MSKHIEKIGRPSMPSPEGGSDIELGQPIIREKFKRESIEAVRPALKEALEEFYMRRSKHDEYAKLALQAMSDAERPYDVAEAELKKKNGDTVLALAILESLQGEFQFERDLIENQELESEAPSENGELGEKRRHDIEEEMHYQEVADRLFSRAAYAVPTRADLVDWLAEMRWVIKKLAGKEAEKYHDLGQGEDIGKRMMRSRLLSDVPAIERFQSGDETTRDYRQIIDVVNTRLLDAREQVGTFLLQYASKPKAKFKDYMAASLIDVRKLELFLALLEGERNERVAKRWP